MPLNPYADYYESLLRGFDNPLRGVVPATRAAPAFPPLLPDEEESTFEFLKRKTLSGLGWLGEALDKPGRFVRGTISGLSGGPWGGGALNLIPFADTAGLTDPSQAVSGRQLLERAGALAPNTEGLDWGDVGGFGADLLFDPLSWVNPAAWVGPAGRALAKSGAKLPGFRQALVGADYLESDLLKVLKAAQAGPGGYQPEWLVQPGSYAYPEAAENLLKGTGVKPGALPANRVTATKAQSIPTPSVAGLVQTAESPNLKGALELLTEGLVPAPGSYRTVTTPPLGGRGTYHTLDIGQSGPLLAPTAQAAAGNILTKATKTGPTPLRALASIGLPFGAERLFGLEPLYLGTGQGALKALDVMAAPFRGADWLLGKIPVVSPAWEGLKNIVPPIYYATKGMLSPTAKGVLEPESQALAPWMRQRERDILAGHKEKIFPVKEGLEPHLLRNEAEAAAYAYGAAEGRPLPGDFKDWSFYVQAAKPLEYQKMLENGTIDALKRNWTAIQKIGTQAKEIGQDILTGERDLGLVNTSQFFDPYGYGIDYVKHQMTGLENLRRPGESFLGHFRRLWNVPLSTRHASQLGRDPALMMPGGATQLNDLLKMIDPDTGLPLLATAQRQLGPDEGVELLTRLLTPGQGELAGPWTGAAPKPRIPQEQVLDTLADRVFQGPWHPPLTGQTQPLPNLLRKLNMPAGFEQKLADRLGVAPADLATMLTKGGKQPAELAQTYERYYDYLLRLTEGATGMPSQPTAAIRVPGEAYGDYAKRMVADGVSATDPVWIREHAKELWDKLGALDPRYAGQNFYDSDLAKMLEIRSAMSAKVQSAGEAITQGFRLFAKPKAAFAGDEAISVPQAAAQLGLTAENAKSQLALALGLGDNPKALSGMFVEKRLVDDWGRWLKPWTAPEEAKPLVDLLDRFTNLFKAWTYTPWPASMTRNLATGVFNMWRDGLGPVDIARNLAKATQIVMGREIESLPQGWRLDAKARQAAIQELYSQGAALNRSQYQAAETLGADPLGRGAGRLPGKVYQDPMATARKVTENLLDKNNLPAGLSPQDVTDAGRFLSKHGFNTEAILKEVGDLKGKVLPKSALDKITGQGPVEGTLEWAKTFYKEGRSYRPFDVLGVAPEGTPENAILASGRKIHSFSEDILRAAHYLALREKGFAPAGARQSVIKYHFDYLDQARADPVLRRLMPWYMFSSRNLPPLLEDFATKPAKLAATVRTLTGPGREQGTFTPPYLAEAGAVPVPGGPEGQQRFLSSFGLPVEDEFFKALGTGLGFKLPDALRSAMGGLTPLLKWPVETATGTQLHTGRKLTDLRPGALSTGFGLLSDETAGPISHFTANTPLARLASAIDKIDRTALLSGQASVPGTAANLLSGVRSADVDMAKAEAAALRDYLIESLAGHPNVKSFTKPYAKKEDLPKLSPEEILLLRVGSTLEKRAQEEKKKAGRR